MTSSTLIPRQRLKWIPKDLQLAHEYCFYLHDESARLLVEYEAAGASAIKVNFRSKAAAARFFAFDNPIDALRAGGYLKQARRVILSQITMAMVSDCLHHLFEALKCLEKRKVIVAMNLLRKPLTDNLMYLSWMLADEDDFYEGFTGKGPEALTPKQIGNRREALIAGALARTRVKDLLDPAELKATLFDSKNPHGFYRLFQHAVHLIIVERIELKTDPENFNFIFKSYADDDLYHGLYEQLPSVMLYLSHVILELFGRIKRMEKGGKTAFGLRSIFAFHLVRDDEGLPLVQSELERLLSRQVACTACDRPLAMTRHNLARVVLKQTFRCTGCRVVNPMPFSWLF